MSTRYAIVDDEQASIDVTESLLAQIGDYVHVDSWRSPTKAVTEIPQRQIDLLFLDVEMPSLDGLSLLRKLQDPPITILVTAHPEYAVDAFALGVREYMLKPVSSARLATALANVQPLIQARRESAARGQSLALKKGYESRLIDPAEILYFESDGNFARMVLKVGKDELISESLRSLTERLEGFGFARIHKTLLVNCTYITGISASQVTLLESHQLPVGRAYRTTLTAWSKRLNLPY